MSDEGSKVHYVGRRCALTLPNVRLRMETIMDYYALMLPFKIGCLGSPVGFDGVDHT